MWYTGLLDFIVFTNFPNHVFLGQASFPQEKVDKGPNSREEKANEWERHRKREGEQQSSDMEGSASNLVVMVSKSLHFSREMTSDPSELITMHTPENHKNKQILRQRAKMCPSLVVHSHTHTICLSSALSLMSNHTDTQRKVTHSSPSVYMYDFSWVMRRDCWYRFSRTKHLLQAKHHMVALHLVLQQGHVRQNSGPTAHWRNS